MLWKVFRQQDPVFVNTLNRIRTGRPTNEDIALLHGTAAQRLDTNGVIATQLCTHVSEASAINAASVILFTLFFLLIMAVKHTLIDG